MPSSNGGPDLSGDEQGLIESAQRGDADAYGELVRRHQRAAIRAAAVAAGNASDAEDAAQEGFVKAYDAIGRFRAGAPFRPWLLRIVTNAARNRQRTAQRQRALAVRAGSLAVVPQDSPADLVGAAEDRSRLVAALGRLDDRDRLILAYRWFEDLSEAEIATAVGCRRGTVKSRLSRAMARLRVEMDDGGETS
jgi:RNA polymerase sigma-70 factor (ECF subfamily)